jgi:hypothetical protein
MSAPKTWLIVGASRVIGLEFVCQIVALGHRVIATVRSANTDIDALVQSAPGQVQILTCDVSREESINVRLLIWLSQRNNRLKIWRLGLYRTIRSIRRAKDRLCGHQCWGTEISECKPLLL